MLRSPPRPLSPSSRASEKFLAGAKNRRKSAVQDDHAVHDAGTALSRGGALCLQPAKPSPRVNELRGTREPRIYCWQIFLHSSGQLPGVTQHVTCRAYSNKFPDRDSDAQSAHRLPASRLPTRQQMSTCGETRTTGTGAECGRWNRRDNTAFTPAIFHQQYM